MVRKLPVSCEKWRPRDNHKGALKEGTAAEGEEADKLSLDGVAAEDEDDVPLTSIAKKAVPKNAAIKPSKNTAAEKSPMGGIASEDVENFPLGIASELPTEGFASEDADTFFPGKGIAAKKTDESPVEEGIAAEDTDIFDSNPIEAIDTEYAMDLPAITGPVNLAEDGDDSDGAVKTPVGKGHSKGSKNSPGAEDSPVGKGHSKGSKNKPGTENSPVARRFPVAKPFPAATQDSVRAPFPSANAARKDTLGTKSFTVTRQISANKQKDDAKKRELALAGYESDSDDDAKPHPVPKEDFDASVPNVAAPTPKRKLDKNWVSSWSTKPLSLPKKIETNQTKGMTASTSSTAKRIRVDPIDSSAGNETTAGRGEVVAEVLGRKVALRPITIKSFGASKEMEEKKDTDESGSGWKKEDKWKDNEWKKDDWKKDDKWKKDDWKKDDKNGWNDWKKDDNWKRKTDGEDGDKWKNGWNNSGWKDNDWKRKDEWEWDDKTKSWKKKDETDEKKEDAPQKDEPVSDPLPKSTSQVKPNTAPPRPANTAPPRPAKPLPPGFPTSISEWERPEIQRKMFPNLPVLPRGWVRCCTKSTPHQMYYFKKSSGRTTFEMADVLKSRAA